MFNTFRVSFGRLNVACVLNVSRRSVLKMCCRIAGFSRAFLRGIVALVQCVIASRGRLGPGLRGKQAFLGQLLSTMSSSVEVVVVVK